MEIAATREARWFLARAGDEATGAHLLEQLRAAYPQAALRPLDAAQLPVLDPAYLRAGEQAAAYALVLRAPDYLPLRTFEDGAVQAGRSAQADPVLGILGALGNLPDGWRALSQFVVRPAPEAWARERLRLALEHPLAAERAAGRGASGDASPVGVVLLAVAMLVVAVGLRAHRWYAGGECVADGAPRGHARRCAVP